MTPDFEANKILVVSDNNLMEFVYSLDTGYVRVGVNMSLFFYPYAKMGKSTFSYQIGMFLT